MQNIYIECNIFCDDIKYLQGNLGVCAVARENTD